MTEEFFRIFDNLLEGVIVLDDKRNILYINEEAQKTTGFTKEEAIGRKCYEILRSSLCSKNCPIEKFSDSDKSKTYDPDIIDKNNETKRIKLKVFRYKNLWIEIFNDITREYELERSLKENYFLSDIITRNKKLLETIKVLPKIAISDAPVLIEGESGTGKELFATAIKNLSLRKDKPFIKINCAALPDSLLESELFGYKKGAFTDAKKDKPGLFVMADGGTIFLDEIGEMSLQLQAKLLRAVETGEVYPLGATKPVKFNTRIISATNKNLKDEVLKGKFREDLYFRLNVVNIKIPPLRERKEDIPLLAEFFIRRLNTVRKRNIKGISSDALYTLLQYDFPGNVRELKNVIEYSFIFCDGDYIEKKHLPPYLFEKEGDEEKEKIISALEKAKWNKKRAAEILGMNRTTLWRKMKKYGIV